MSEGLGILMALAALVGPLLLAFYLVNRYLGSRKRGHKVHNRPE